MRLHHIYYISRQYTELLITTRFHFDKESRGKLAVTYGLTSNRLRTRLANPSLKRERMLGSLIQPKTYFKPMGKHANIFQIQIYSIDSCLSFNLERNYRGQKIAVLTDSQADIKVQSGEF